MDNLEYKHDKLKSLGKIGKDDADLYVHYAMDGNTFHYGFVTIEYGFIERDFKDITKAYDWLFERQRQQKQIDRQAKNAYQRNRYWKEHTNNMH